MNTRDLALAVALLLSLGTACGQREPEETARPSTEVMKSAQADGAAASGGFAAPAVQPVTATLVSEHTALPLGGQTRIGILFELEDGWHIYGEDPGDAGMPTKISWSASGTSFGALQWPDPQEFVDPGDITTFGYETKVLLSSSLTHLGPWNEAQPPTALPINAQVKWLSCDAEICVPGNADLELALPLTAQESPNAPLRSPNAQLFDQTG